MTGTVLTTRVFEFPNTRRPLAQTHISALESEDQLPAVPAMPETLLAMELQLQHRSVDLHEISQAVLADMGATIQILRLAGREYGHTEDRPTRIEECICDLGLTACLDAVARGSLARGARQRSIQELWAHSREIAVHARQVAEQMPCSIHPEQAYLAGLLHSIGLVPVILEWTPGNASNHRAFSSLRLAERWALPSFIRDYFCEMCMPGYAPEWSNLMAEAHRRAHYSLSACPLDACSSYPSAS